MKKTIVLIQCADCKYCELHCFPERDIYSCTKNQMRGDGDVYPNDYCSLAIKRPRDEGMAVTIWKYNEELDCYEPEDRPEILEGEEHDF